MASNPFSKFAEEVLSGFKNKFHHKRSHKAIVIPSNHGDAYLVSHARRASTPLWGSTNQTSTSNGTSASTQSQDLPMGAVPGTMAIAVCDCIYNSRNNIELPVEPFRGRVQDDCVPLWRRAGREIRVRRLRHKPDATIPGSRFQRRHSRAHGKQLAGEHTSHARLPHGD